MYILGKLGSGQRHVRIVRAEDPLPTYLQLYSVFAHRTRMLVSGGHYEPCQRVELAGIRVVHEEVLNVVVVNCQP